MNRCPFLKYGILLALGSGAACSGRISASSAEIPPISHAAAAPPAPASLQQAIPVDAGQVSPSVLVPRSDMQAPVPLYYQSQLQEGRRLTAAGSWQEAAAALVAALHAKPDDAAALSELSYVEISLEA